MYKKRQLAQSRYTIDGHGDPIEMTLPDERYRAIKWAEEFMQDLMDSSRTPRVPKEIRQRARSVLRHYPGSYYIDQLAQARPDIIAKDMDDLVKFVRSRERDQDPEVVQPIQAEERDPSL